MSQHLRKDLQDAAAQAPYVRPHEPAGLVRAHMNEMTGDWPAGPKAKWLEALRTIDMGVYPESQGELTARLERRLGAAAGSVLLGPSSGALLDLLALAGLDAGDVVAVPEPGFSLYPLLVKRAQGVLRRVPVGTVFPLDGFFAAAREGAKQLWITLPNNPTGAWIPPARIDELCLEIASMARPPLVVVDEAYAEFAPETARLLVDRFDFVVVVRTFSKALGSAGLRLGYLIGAPALVSRLATLQLPYSIPVPSLLALSVALDDPAPFEAAVETTLERRARLVAALRGAGVEVAESAANFVYVAPEKAAELRAQGLLVRALPGTTAMRVSLAEEATAAAVAKAYGTTLAAPPGEVRRHAPLLVLDIDGVLIEAEASFRTAVARALAELAADLPWDDRLFRTMKRAPGMNNDFRLTAALMHLWRAGQARFAPVAAGTGPTFDEADLTAIEALVPEAAARVAHHYETTQALEAALATAADLAELPGTHAIYTGRNVHELGLAAKILGFQLPAVVDRGAHVRKPAAGGLLQLRDAFRATSVMFVGDTRDDAAALRAAQAELPHVRFGFCAVGPAREEIVPSPDGHATLSFPTFRDAKPALAAWLHRDAR
ncbi:MAG: aminotransferase class I/II-fold pyridoxal phosphate-dependent enzyme [Polyangiaceae bacterium]|nr:aminotransferase class I/II-fold pyridoxal phosphate-dependent enzyme [Polyangiaceae bacterium]